jgi:hypothetical protein
MRTVWTGQQRGRSDDRPRADEGDVVDGPVRIRGCRLLLGQEVGTDGSANANVALALGSRLSWTQRLVTSRRYQQSISCRRLAFRFHGSRAISAPTPQREGMDRRCPRARGARGEGASGWRLPGRSPSSPGGAGSPSACGRGQDASRHCCSRLQGLGAVDRMAIGSVSDRLSGTPPPHS